MAPVGVKGDYPFMNTDHTCLNSSFNKRLIEAVRILFLEVANALLTKIAVKVLHGDSGSREPRSCKNLGLLDRNQADGRTRANTGLSGGRALP